MGTPQGPSRRDLPDPGRDETRIAGETEVTITGNITKPGGVSVGRDIRGDIHTRDYYDSNAVDIRFDRPRAPSVIGLVVVVIGLAIIVGAVVLGMLGQLSDLLPWVLVGAALMALGIVVTVVGFLRH